MSIEEIKKYMKQNKISYEKLAGMTGLSVSTITKIFGGFAKYPRVDTMQAIEKALGLETPEEQWADKKRVGITADEEEMLDVFREIGEKFGAEAQARAIELVRVAFLKDNK